MVEKCIHLNELQNTEMQLSILTFVAFNIPLTTLAKMEAIAFPLLLQHRLCSDNDRIHTFNLKCLIIAAVLSVGF